MPDINGNKGGNYNPGPRVAETAEGEERRKSTLFKAGNPGRPRGTRVRLTERFIADLCEDWHEHGVAVLRRVREEDPSIYVRVVASMVPKELEIKRPLQEMSDEELADAITAVRAALGERAEGVGAGIQDAPRGKPH